MLGRTRSGAHVERAFQLMRAGRATFSLSTRLIPKRKPPSKALMESNYLSRPSPSTLRLCVHRRTRASQVQRVAEKVVDSGAAAQASGAAATMTRRTEDIKEINALWGWLRTMQQRSDVMHHSGTWAEPGRCECGRSLMPQF